MDTDEEESINYELGWRHTGGPLYIETVGFFNDYSNLLGMETVSGGGDTTGDLFNGGDVDVSGLELTVGYELGTAQGWAVKVPLRVSYTYTSAEFQSSFETSFADWAPRGGGWR